MAIVVVVILLVAILSYVVIRRTGEDYDEGDLVLHDHTYQYTISIQNVTGPYEVIVPLVVVRSGEALKLMDFEDVAPGRCELVNTDHGWGLKVWGEEPVHKSLKGEVTGLRESELDDYGYPFLSMVDGDIELLRPWEEEEMSLWMSSSCSTLKVHSTVRFDSHREWINWYGKITWTSGSGSMLELSNTTALGWKTYRFEYEGLYIAN